MGFLIADTGKWPRVLGAGRSFPDGEYDKFFLIGIEFHFVSAGAILWFCWTEIPDNAIILSFFGRDRPVWPLCGKKGCKDTMK